MISEFTSLAEVTDSVNQAHFFGEKIGKREAGQAIDWLTSCYRQDLPKSILESKRPNPKWAAMPKSFALTEEDRASKLKAFTGEPVQNASMRAIYSRETARALLILSKLTGRDVPEAETHSHGVGAFAGLLKDQGKPLFCCGPCTASVLRLLSTDGMGDCSEASDHFIDSLKAHRNDKGEWRRFPFFFTLLALIGTEGSKASEEIEFVLPAAEKKMQRLKPKDDVSNRRIAVLERAFERTS